MSIMNCRSIFAALLIAVVAFLTVQAGSARAGSVYSNAVLADNPVAFYEMNEAALSTTAVDAVAAHNGTYTYGSPTGLTLGVAGPQPPAFVGFNPPPTNTAMAIAGAPDSGGRLDTGTAIPTLGTAFSLDFWFYHVHNGSSTSYVVGRYGASYPGDDLFFGGETLKYFDGFTVTTGPTVAVNAWEYLALTDDGTTVKVYLNGALAFSAPSTDEYGTSTRLVAGERGDNVASTAFNGSLDELAVYNAVLSSTQIANHYAAAFTIPEPASLGLTAVGGLLLLRRRRA